MPGVGSNPLTPIVKYLVIVSFLRSGDSADSPPRETERTNVRSRGTTTRPAARPSASAEPGLTYADIGI